MGRQLAMECRNRRPRQINGIDEERINRAIQDCLDNCREASDRVAQVAAFLTGLKSAGWNRVEIRAVELAVHKILHAIADTARYSKDETDPEQDQIIF